MRLPDLITLYKIKKSGQLYKDRIHFDPNSEDFNDYFEFVQELPSMIDNQPLGYSSTRYSDDDNLIVIRSNIEPKKCDYCIYNDRKFMFRELTHSKKKYSMRFSEVKE